MTGLDTCFLKVSAHALLKVATKGSFRGQKSGNLAFLVKSTKKKQPERLKCLHKIWLYINGLI